MRNAALHDGRQTLSSLPVVLQFYDTRTVIVTIIENITEHFDIYCALSSSLNPGDEQTSLTRHRQCKHEEREVKILNKQPIVRS